MACIFCQIVARQAEASIVYEDEQVMAFMDLFPVNRGHVLVVPKAHYAELRDIPESTLNALTRAMQRIEKAVWKLDPACTGTNILLNNGKDAGQEVFHAHFHVIPRFPDDGVRFRFTPARPGRAALDQDAADIRSLL